MTPPSTKPLDGKESELLLLPKDWNDTECIAEHTPLLLPTSKGPLDGKESELLSLSASSSNAPLLLPPLSSNNWNENRSREEHTVRITANFDQPSAEPPLALAPESPSLLLPPSSSVSEVISLLASSSAPSSILPSTSLSLLSSNDSASTSVSLARSSVSIPVVSRKQPSAPVADYLLLAFNSTCTRPAEMPGLQERAREDSDSSSNEKGIEESKTEASYEELPSSKEPFDRKDSEISSVSKDWNDTFTPPSVSDRKEEDPSTHRNEKDRWKSKEKGDSKIRSSALAPLSLLFPSSNLSSSAPSSILSLALTPLLNDQKEEDQTTSALALAPLPLLPLPSNKSLSSVSSSESIEDLSMPRKAPDPLPLLLPPTGKSISSANPYHRWYHHQNRLKYYQGI